MASSIFSGMEDFGLGDMSTKDIFNNPEAEEKKAKAAAAAKEVKEEVFLFDKTYECPVCYKNFKERTLRTGKARLIKTDLDLRPTFEGIEPLKYDVVQCTECGFTALTRYFVPMTVPQRKAILEKITSRYRKPAERKALYSYEDAVGRYKLALVNAIVKNAKASEKAYICLRAGWLARSYAEYLEEQVPVIYEGDFSCLLEDGKNASEVEKRLQIQEEVKAPIEEGQSLGSLEYYLGDKKLGEIKILAEKNIEAAKYKDYLKRVWLAWMM